MTLIGHGIDLVEIERVAEMAHRHGDRFLHRCFTEAERAYAEEGGKRRDERLAARFAAKEAALKALGTGWRSGITWQDVEVTRLPSGQPDLQLTGHAATVASDLGITRWLLSLSHSHSHAMASAIALRNHPRD